MIMMGFERENAIFALKKTQYEGEPRAVQYLTERDPSTGKYEHEFIEYAQN